MGSDIDWLAKRDALRATAEGLLRGFGKVLPDKGPTDILMNELLIHKVELEVQIEELKRSSFIMEESRDRYLDLYDRSSVGFVTINRDGQVTEINLVAAKLLGVDRSNFINEQFTNHIAAEDLDKWKLHFFRIMSDTLANMQSENYSETQSFSIRMIHADASVFTVYIYCQSMTTEDHLPALRLTLIDYADIFDAIQDA